MLRNIVNSSIRQISVGLTGVVSTRFYQFHRSIIVSLLPTPATPIFTDYSNSMFVSLAQHSPSIIIAGPEHVLEEKKSCERKWEDVMGMEMGMARENQKQADVPVEVSRTDQAVVAAPRQVQFT